MIPLKDINPTERFPIVTVLIILACTIIFIGEISLPQDELASLVYSYGAVPSRLIGPDANLAYGLFSIFTSMFLHGGFMHLIGNMLYLWIFGNNVEDRLGHGPFFLFYLLCGYAAAFVQAIFAANMNTPMIGASGAIAGLLAGYLVLFPGARIRTLVAVFYYITLVDLPAYFVIGIWFLLQLVSSIGSIGIESGVAYFAHVGGFVAGLLLINLFPKKRRQERILPGDYDLY